MICLFVSRPLHFAQAVRLRGLQAAATLNGMPGGSSGKRSRLGEGSQENRSNEKQVVFYICIYYMAIYIYVVIYIWLLACFWVGSLDFNFWWFFTKPPESVTFCRGANSNQGYVYYMVIWSFLLHTVDGPNPFRTTQDSLE